MQKQSLLIALLMTVSIVFLSHCSGKIEAAATTSLDSAAAAKFVNGGYESQVKWGQHLIGSLGCNDCHTPKKMTPFGPVPDSSLYLSGHPAHMPPPPVDRKEIQAKGLGVTQTETAWVGPWGISYAPNLTSDSTGIGGWKEEQFVFAIREGKYMGLAGARPMLPPMPWTSYRNLSDQELKAMFAFLKTTKAINNVAPTAEPPVK